MKKQLIDELTNTLSPHIEGMSITDLRLKLEIALSEYDISKQEHSLIVYEGDVNELILNRFLSAKIAQGCSKNTMRYYRNSIRMALEKIGKPYMDVTADDIRLFVATRIY